MKRESSIWKQFKFSFSHKNSDPYTSSMFEKRIDEIFEKYTEEIIGFLKENVVSPIEKINKKLKRLNEKQKRRLDNHEDRITGLEHEAKSFKRVS